MTQESQALDETVFIVDDEFAVRDSLSALLEVENYTVETFERAGSFLARLDRGCRGCVVLDVRLPDMNGIELLRELTDRGVRLPVIVMTGYADVSIAVKAMKFGAMDFVEKPFTDEVFLGLVREALQVEAMKTREEVARNEILDRLDRLTPREREVLDCLVEGHQNKEIAHILDISPRTVEIHRARVMEKMDARSLSHLVRMALSVSR